jgi:beta-lactamase superfamily II metal-dependent hydrolase
VDLIPEWVKECEDANLIPGIKARRRELNGVETYGPLDVETLAATPFDPDRTKPNGTSIALLAQYQGKRALLGADAHVDRLLESLKLLRRGRMRFAIDVLKVPHHGSERNVSKELLDAIQCPLYLISTSGAYSKHPRRIVIARILKYGGTRKTIAFNYTSKFTKIWNRSALKTTYRYETIYPTRKSNGTLAVRLLD